jgi:hypothetical protein
MSDDSPGASAQELQFDRVLTETAPSMVAAKPYVACESCQRALETEYYQINGHMFCEGCRTRIEASAETPSGIGPLLMAGTFGLGAGVAGAAIYYAVIALTNLEIGIVAILIGYMVGYAVRRGAKGRGGRRFQVLAVALTYLAVAFAYTPIAFKQSMEAHRASRADVAATKAESTNHADASSTPSIGSFLVAVGILVGLIVGLPLLVVFGSLPSGLISGLIILIGMRQAWQMTGAPTLEIYGPYRVGAESMTTPV